VGTETTASVVVTGNNAATMPSRPDTTTRPGQATLSAPPVAREFPTLKRTSVSLEAAEAIKALIVSGELASGDALPAERNLAAMLGISRPSVREALRVLTAMNVVEPRHGGGTYVTSLDPRLLARPINFLLQVEPRTFLHLFEVRQVLEVSAARLAAPNITDEVVADLQRLADDAAGALKQPNRFSELDFQLHTRIVEALGNPIYLSLYESISDLLLESRRRTARIASVRRRAHQDHLAILAALRERDPEAAGRAMQDHLERMRQVLDDLLSAEER
jgi:GntR family transcriptional regulator, transcriptional repressor for pyruvate dehydrogenase complex